MGKLFHKVKVLTLKKEDVLKFYSKINNGVEQKANKTQKRNFYVFIWKKANSFFWLIVAHFSTVVMENVFFFKRLLIK